jgi:hypothetical protein
MHARACAPWHYYAAAGQCAVVRVRFGHGFSGSVLAVECAACRVGFRLSSFSLVLLLPVVPVVVAAGAAAAALAPCMLLVACRVALGIYSRVALGIHSRVALGIYSRVTLGIAVLHSAFIAGPYRARSPSRGTVPSASGTRTAQTHKRSATNDRPVP